MGQNQFDQTFLVNVTSRCRVMDAWLTRSDVCAQMFIVVSKHNHCNNLSFLW